MITIICKVCGKTAIGRNRTKVYCSVKCRNADRDYCGHDYQLKSSQLDDCVCPKCGRSHRRRNSEKHRFCKKCEELLLLYNIEDTIGKEHKIYY